MWHVGGRSAVCLSDWVDLPIVCGAEFGLLVPGYWTRGSKAPGNVCVFDAAKLNNRTMLFESIIYDANGVGSGVLEKLLLTHGGSSLSLSIFIAKLVTSTVSKKLGAIEM